MFNEGFIKLNRNITNWGWYKNPNTFRVFVHLLIKSNFTETQFETHTIKRGQLITTTKKLSEELNLSAQEIKTALRHLKSTNEISTKGFSRYSIITIKKYNEYQKDTKNQLSANQQSTIKQQQYNKDYKDDKDYNAKNYKKTYRGFHTQRPRSYSLSDFKPLFDD